MSSARKRATPPRSQPRREVARAPLPVAEVQAVAESPFPIVGVGASAGGLDAFKQLLQALPDDTGMAYVLVQHLSPEHGSMLAQLLATSSRMPVSEIADGMPVEANRVYIIPPERDVALSHGRLSLVPRTTTRGLHMPFDHFLRSLADTQRGKAIAVVLSGTGSDGTLGLKAVKGEGGITFAQEPGSAAHDGMPRSAIAAGCVDLVLEPPLIARELARLGRHPYVLAPVRLAPGSVPAASGARQTDGLAKVLSLVRSATGADFSAYKLTTIERRVVRRMALAGIEGIDEYARHLDEHPEEVLALYRDCLINVTSFFRDPEAFEALRDRVVDPLLRDRAPESPIRVWVPGCATGEEAYSIAICLLERAGELSNPPALQVFATDISEAALEKARAGAYLETIAQDVSPERLRRFFVRANGGYQVTKTVRDLCVFARHNLIKDPPFSRLDLISCRNVLIYLETELQTRVLAAFHYALHRRGFLMLGRSETTGALGEQFSVVDKQQRIFARNDGVAAPSLGWPVPAVPAAHPAPATPPRGELRLRTRTDLPGEAERILLARYAPAGVVVDESLKILEFHGDTAAYLEHPQGRAGLGLLRMARKGLLHDLRKAVDEARRLGTAALRENVTLSAGDKLRRVDIEALPLPATGNGCLLVTFRERSSSTGPAHAPTLPPRRGAGGPTRRLQQENAELRKELQENAQHLHATTQEHERAAEELQSANEEVLSANEELQSINEELETAKEELQSTNEELSTINQELQERNRQLGSVNDDLVNLLTSVNLPLVILGRDLRLRRFTPAAEKLFGLIPADVGRPLGDLRSSFDTSTLEADVLGTIDTMQAKEREVVDREGRFYMLQIRPYRTRENKIDGAVVVLFDVDGLKRALDDANAIVDTAREPLVILDGDLRVERANQSFYDLLAVSAQETEGRLLYELGDGQWVTADLRRTLQQVLPQEARVADYVLDQEFPRIGRRTLVLSARRLRYVKGGKDRILLAIEDRTEAQRTAEEREKVLALETEARRRAEETDRIKDEFVATLSHELRGPLGSIAGWVHVLQSRDTDEATAAQARAAIERGVRAQVRMIDELLDYSRMAKGKLRLAQLPTDLVEVTKAALLAVQAAAAAKEISLAFTSDAGRAVILGDRDRLQQIAWNLLSNAVKFTPRGGRVSVAVRSVRSQMALCVSDNGKGIAPAFLPHVFERFRQAEGRPSRSEQGLGLGLAIVRNLVELHGGTVRAESPGESQGSTFTATFPVPTLLLDTVRGEDAEPSAGAPLTDLRWGDPDRRPLEGVRLLVVEDDADSRQMLGAVFEQAGADVRHASSAQEALEEIAQALPDVLTCDIGLPGEDGFALIRRVRDLPPERGGRVPALALTAYARQEDCAKALASGFEVYLGKPAAPAELVRSVAALAGRDVDPDPPGGERP
jgi:two-component system, chemotaxis family, CheB/CheR fusion protein